MVIIFRKRWSQILWDGLVLLVLISMVIGLSIAYRQIELIVCVVTCFEMTYISKVEWYVCDTRFSSWNKSERFASHVGGMNSFHNIAFKMSDSLKNQKHSIAQPSYKHDDVVKNEYRFRLNTSVDASIYMLRQGIPFRAHDEWEDAVSKGIFLELIRYTANKNKTVSKVGWQLNIYIDNIREDGRFNNLESLGDLSRSMVETQKHLAHPLVYRLLKLALTLLFATTTVERCFSAMKLVKTASRNRNGDQFLSDCLVCFIEKGLFASVTNETVMKKF